MSLPEFSISGKTAIVTGASRGIGKAIALTFAEAGADLCICARTKDALDDVADRARAMGRKVVAVPADVTKARDVEEMVRQASDVLGGIDILVNNVGAMIVKPMVPLPGFRPASAGQLPDFFGPYSEAEWSHVMDTNLKSTFLCMRTVGPRMIEGGGGKVINSSSVAAVKAGRYRFTYDVSKSGMSQLTRSMAVEWARYNINVNAIGSGYIQTEMTEALAEDQRLRQRMLSEIPLRRMGTVREVALLAVYLASPASDYITGQTLFLDGGMLA